jgi:hypothetical protein
MRDVVEGFLDLLTRDRTLAERALDAVTQFGLVERLAPIVALDDVRHYELGRLERRKSLCASQALAPTAHLTALASQS